MSCLGLPVLYWIELLKMSIPAYFLILKENLLVFTSEYDVSCGIFNNSQQQLYWDKFLLRWFVDSFCRGCVWNFIKCFTFMYWYECVIFILHSANVVYHIYWGAYGGPFFQYNNNRLSKKIIKKKIPFTIAMKN